MNAGRGLIRVLSLILALTGSEMLAAGRIDDHGTYLVYVPESLAQGQKCPLVLALSPGGDAAGALHAWTVVADRHGWLIAASKEFRNGIPFQTVLPQLVAALDSIEHLYPVDLSRVVLTGLSGGAMGSHAFAGFHPDRVRAVVANTGMMEETFMVANYPRDKLAVFLASPTDFRYQEMKRDRQFLDQHGWSTSWFEFTGGHTLAPAETYLAAADWLTKHW
jgi:poly(3-hydroxybutyrate) depolymerase